MTDRELLEAAARAAGICIYFDEDGDCYRNKESGNRQYWNPLTFDGDAFRLAVKLGLRVDIGWDKYTYVDWVGRSDDKESGEIEQPFDCDPYAATRRAIVRAAAQIGGKQ